MCDWKKIKNIYQLQVSQGFVVVNINIIGWCYICKSNSYSKVSKSNPKLLVSVDFLHPLKLQPDTKTTEMFKQSSNPKTTQKILEFIIIKIY